MSDKHTPGPWSWLVHDVSMASLGVGSDPGMGTPLVLNVSPCRSCIDSASPNEWEWGRCTTPSEADARLIAAAPELLSAIIDLADAARTACNAGQHSELVQALFDADYAIAKAHGVAR